MKTIISKILFGRDNRISGLIALGIVGMIALGCNCGKTFDLANLSNSNGSAANSSDDTEGKDGLPSKGLLDALVKETTADFNYAITFNDFSKMYAKASSDFQSTYTEAEMKSTFKEFVDKKRVITPILAKTVSMEPEYSPEPYIRTEKGLDILVVNGKYATKPVPMNFEYEYVKRNDQWKLLKLIIRLT
jgi:hypothetical protein